MWEIIRENKRKSRELLIWLVALFYLVSFAIGVLCGIFFYSLSGYEAWFNFDKVLVNIGKIGLLSVLISNLFLIALPFVENSIIKKHKNEFSDVDLQRLCKPLKNILEEMCIASGLAKKPALYMIDSSLPNAYAMAQPNGESAIFLTVGLLWLLNRGELQAVLAHEIAHIKNFDSQYLTRAFLLTSLLSSGRGFLLGEDNSKFGAVRRASFRYRCDSGSKGMPPQLLLIAIIAFIIVFVVGPIVSKLIYFGISRKREFLADACAAQYTRYPHALASALYKITESHTSGSSMFYGRKFSSEERMLDAFNFFPIQNAVSEDGLLATHPSAENRIAILSKMGGSGLLDYQNAFKNATGQSFFGSMLSGDAKTQAIIEPQNGHESLPGRASNMTVNASMVAVAAVLAASGVTGGAAEAMQKKFESKQIVNDVRAEANRYVTINCDCDTRLKFPPAYQGTTQVCPHCLKEHFVGHFEEKGEL